MLSRLKLCIFLLLSSNVSNMSHAALSSCHASYADQHYQPAQKQTADNYAIYALLSHNAYRNEPFYFRLPNNWHKSGYYADSSGLSYQTYELKKEGETVEAVMVFPGTEGIKDWVNGNVSRKQIRRAKPHIAKFMQRYSGVPKIVTGHSLGGSLAMYASYEFAGLSAVGFQVPPRKTPKAIPPNTRVIINEKGDFAPKIGNFWFPDRWISGASMAGVYYQQFDFVPPTFTQAHDSFSLAYGLLRVGSLSNPDLDHILKQNCQ